MWSSPSLALSQVWPRPMSVTSPPLLPALPTPILWPRGLPRCSDLRPWLCFPPTTGPFLLGLQSRDSPDRRSQGSSHLP